MGIFRVVMKKNKSIFDAVPERYWREEFFDKVKMLVRGYFFKCKMKESGKRLLVGYGTKIFNANYLEIGDKVLIGNYVKIQAYSRLGIKIGSDTQIGDYTIINGTSIPNNPGNGLIIGNKSSFGEFCYFGCAGGIEIGDNVIGGQNIRFHSENHNYSSLELPIMEQGVVRKGIKVGSNVWIGAGVVFLDGTIVGDGCVIAANSVLNRTYPNNSVIVGTPGRVIKCREQI